MNNHIDLLNIKVTFIDLFVNEFLYAFNLDYLSRLMLLSNDKNCH